MFSEVLCTHNLFPASGTFFWIMPVSHVKSCSGISCTLQEKAHGIRRSHTSSKTERDLARNHGCVIMSNSVHYYLIEEEFVSAGLLNRDLSQDWVWHVPHEDSQIARGCRPNDMWTDKLLVTKDLEDARGSGWLGSRDLQLDSQGVLHPMNPWNPWQRTACSSPGRTQGGFPVLNWHVPNICHNDPIDTVLMLSWKVCRVLNSALLQMSILNGFVNSMRLSRG